MWFTRSKKARTVCETMHYWNWLVGNIGWFSRRTSAFERWLKIGNVRAAISPG